MSSLIAKKIVITINSSFGLPEASKQAVLDALAIDLLYPGGVTNYQQDAKVEIQIITEAGTVINLPTICLKTAYDLLPDHMKIDVALNILPDYDGKRFITENELTKLRSLSQEEIFEAWCLWNGLVNYNSQLISAYRAIFELRKKLG